MTHEELKKKLPILSAAYETRPYRDAEAAILTLLPGKNQPFVFMAFALAATFNVDLADMPATITSSYKVAWPKLRQLTFELAELMEETARGVEEERRYSLRATADMLKEALGPLFSNVDINGIVDNHLGKTLDGRA